MQRLPAYSDGQCTRNARRTPGHICETTWAGVRLAQRVPAEHDQLGRCLLFVLLEQWLRLDDRTFLLWQCARHGRLGSADVGSDKRRVPRRHSALAVLGEQLWPVEVGQCIGQLNLPAAAASASASSVATRTAVLVHRHLLPARHTGFSHVVHSFRRSVRRRRAGRREYQLRVRYRLQRLWPSMRILATASSSGSASSTSGCVRMRDDDRRGNWASIASPRRPRGQF